MSENKKSQKDDLCEQKMRLLANLIIDLLEARNCPVNELQPQVGKKAHQ